MRLTLAPPPAPTNVVGSSTDGKITVEWNVVPEVTDYVVEQHKNVFIGSDWHKLPFDSFTVTVPQVAGLWFTG